MSISRREFMETALAGTVSMVSATSAAGQTRDTNVTELTLHEASDLVRRKKISPVELTGACLSRIDQLNPSLNAFITVTGDQAMEDAKKAEQEIQQGKWRGPLHGIPISLKDLFDTAGVRTTAASALFKDRVPKEDSEVVRRLKSAGAILVGKTNMHEFAYGGTSVVSHFGVVHNPWNRDYVAGGSSGGSAAAVAAGLCYASVGSDTGGSIRQPSAFCGLAGLKPTYGLVSARGVIPLSWTVDHLGPMARNVTDAAMLLQVIAGYDPAQFTSVQMKVDDYSATLRAPLPKIRLGVARDFFFADLHPEIESAVGKALSILEQVTGSKSREVKTDAEEVDQTRVTVRVAEAYAYHAEYLAQNASLYDPFTLTRIKVGADISTTTYIQARRKLEQSRRTTFRLFENVDLIVTPTTPIPTLAIAEVPKDVTAAIAIEKPLMRNTSPFNGYGLPTVSIPCGFTSKGLPIGLQISGPLGADALVLRLAYAYEQATDWHTKSAKVTI